MKSSIARLWVGNTHHRNRRPRPRPRPRALRRILSCRILTCHILDLHLPVQTTSLLKCPQQWTRHC